MLEQQRFRSDGADATEAEQFREGDKQVNREEEQIRMTGTLSRSPISARLHGNGDSR
jgi:hypothetical protein